ncbi:nuclear transport factor 2 family protein [Microvirga sp. 2YAF29]|uniref:nuclear transport factor 2 family protein n=1 Tax=Microvirga sp. 2YAF29 TaxID=3233031 RepID=UPI003F99334C
MYQDDPKVKHALSLVEMHFREENPQDIDNALRLYTDDIVWEVPGRRVRYEGKQAVKENYLRLFDAVEEIDFEPIDRFATPDRVVDDMWVRFKLIGPGIENHILPIGSRVKMRLVHIFHVRDGLICREAGYESWLLDD